MQEPITAGPNPRAPQTPSPCTKVCVLDAAGLCVGCYRTSQEIALWSRASETTKRHIIKQTQRRRLLEKK